MTVVLAGIGADTTNVGALGPLSEDGTFEYVPIPEKTRETTETATFGTWTLRDGRTAATLTNRVRPRPIAEPDVVLRDEALAAWPVHHDPNFEALTYGEHRYGYVAALETLEPGDVVGFYAGLRRREDGRAHRYLIGSMTVDAVEVITPEMDPDEVAAVFSRHPENAHTKRAVDGRPYLRDKRVVIVDGREPGGLLERHPVRLSEYVTKPGNSRPQYYLRPAVERALDVRSGRENMQFKPAYRAGIDADRFREWIEGRERR